MLLAFIALGSNLGDRPAHLAAARDALADTPGVRVAAATIVEETPPLGGLDQPGYLNQMVAVETALAPEFLLERLHVIEQGRGRTRRERWAPRTLDLDIVAIDGVRRASPQLTLPHPGIPDRDFWQRELRELRILLMADVDSHPASAVDLPDWAVASPKRRTHIARVTALLDSWSAALSLPPDERAAWHDAGRWHDAVRDADAPTLRGMLSDASDDDVRLLHGPAAAHRLAADGESRSDVLDAIRDHTVGSVGWGRTGRALYMADWLDPARAFHRAERAALAARVPDDFDGVFRAVVQRRAEHAEQAHGALLPGTRALLASVR